VCPAVTQRREGRMRDEGAQITLYEHPRRCSLPGRNAVRATAWKGILQGFSGLAMLEVDAWGQGSSGKSGCINRVKSAAPGKEGRFLQTHGVTLTVPLGCSGTAVVTWLVARKTKVTQRQEKSKRESWGPDNPYESVSMRCWTACE